MSKGSKGPLLTTGEGVLPNLRVSPVDGKANAEVERFLAALVGARRSDVAPVRGASGRDKVALVKNVGEARVREALSSHLP